MSTPRTLAPRLILCAMALWALALSGARAEEDLTHKAQEAFNEGRYDQSIKLYEKLVERAPGNPDLLYNLGTAHARAGQRGFAIWRYLQAMRSDPRDGDLNFNLEMLDPEIFQQLAVTPIPPVNWLYLHFTTNEWTAIAGLSALLAMAFGALYIFKFHRATWGGHLRTTGLALLLFAAVAYPFAFTHYFNEDQAWRCVVVADNTVARVAPNVNQTETDTLPVGTVIKVLESKTPGWYKFIYRGGRMGFVERERVRSL